jgi:hypothetical protein
MTKMSLGVLLAILPLPIVAQEDYGQRIVRACVADIARFCHVPAPTADVFRKGGPVETCLMSRISQLSRPCSDVIMSGG